MEIMSPPPFKHSDVSEEPIRAPFSEKFVQLTQAEHIQLKWQGNYWASQYTPLKQRFDDQAQALALAQASILDLKQRLYGKKSEKKGTIKPESVSDTRRNTPRSRGHQKGCKGHGRTARPHLPVIEEIHDIAPEDKMCGTCGQARIALAHTENSTIVEIQIKAHSRLIKRKIYAKACQCDATPGIITALPAARLIPKGSVGISVWTEVLINKFLFSRATYNLCTDYGYRGLPLAPGTLTDGLKRIAPLFEPLITHLIDKQLTEDLFHNDETGWKVFEAMEGKANYKGFLWVTQSASVVYYTLSPSRSGDIPIAYFSGLDKHLDQGVVVCDRYSGYKRLARENTVILLAFCWAHVRRDFLDAAKSWPALTGWMFSWIERISALYHLNGQRLAHWDDAIPLKAQSPDFMKGHQALSHAVTQLYAHCACELKQEGLAPIQRKVLNSLTNHGAGLTVFVDRPQVPMDNNVAERRMRNPGRGRKNYYGSGKQWSGYLAASMFSLFQTILLWQLNPHHGLSCYLTACAENRGQPPTDLSPFIPWTMSEERRQQMAGPLAFNPPSLTPCTHAQSP